jgi:hypothetical protein
VFRKVKLLRFAKSKNMSYFNHKCYSAFVVVAVVSRSGTRRFFAHPKINLI